MATIIDRPVEPAERGMREMQPRWAGATSLVRRLANRLMPPRPAADACGVTGHWLRCHAIESAKHVDHC
jgi:hypothetical protein